MLRTPARDLLRPGFHEQREISRTTANGFYAETAPDGSLRHFGFYRDGEPAGWTVSVEGPRVEARRVSVRRFDPAEEADAALTGGSEEWLREMIDTIYREAEAEQRVCLFCAKTASEAATLIAGPDRYSFICDECVDTCARILESQRSGAE